MSIAVFLRAEARVEFDQAADWYEAQREGLGLEFIAEVNIAIERIATSPTLSPPIYKEIRRKLVRRFPTPSSIASKRVEL